MQDPTRKKSCTPLQDNSLIDRQDKDKELIVIFKLFSDGESKTVSELAQLTGYTNSVICEHLKTILTWKVVELSGTKKCSVTGVELRSYQMRKGADNE